MSNMKFVFYHPRYVAMSDNQFWVVSAELIFVTSVVSGAARWANVGLCAASSLSFDYEWWPFTLACQTSRTSFSWTYPTVIFTLESTRRCQSYTIQWKTAHCVMACQWRLDARGSRKRLRCSIGWQSGQSCLWIATRRKFVDLWGDWWSACILPVNAGDVMNATSRTRVHCLDCVTLYWPLFSLECDNISTRRCGGRAPEARRRRIETCLR